MLLSKIGEFGLIDRMRKVIKTDKSVIVGSGDDCAVLELDAKRYQLFTCDMIVEGVDFNTSDKPRLIGRKAVAISLSDIAACAGIPRYCVVSLGLPKNKSVEFVDALFKGAYAIAKEFKVNIVGGDISRSDRLIIDVSMLGEVEKKNLVLRSGAKKGDIIFTTGPLGGSIRGKHLKFIPRLLEARYLVAHFKPHAMIDVSDGLAGDLGHICAASKVGALLYKELIPLSSHMCSIDNALFDGEDFELLFSLSRQDAKRLLAEKNFFPIGEITESSFGMRLVDGSGKQVELKNKSFRHF